MASVIRTFLSRLAALFARHRRDSELSEEIQAHLDLLAQEHVRRGTSVHEARAAARREFGGVDQIKEVYRDQRGWPFLDSRGQDLRYALRAFRKNRGFAAVAILTSAIGIGANTAIFTLVNSLLLRWLPVRDAASLRVIRPETSTDEWRVWAEHTRAFSGLAAQRRCTPARLGGQVVRLDFVSASYFQVLKVPMLVGGAFAPEDAADGAGDTIVIGYRSWQTRLGGDGGIIGRRIALEPIEGLKRSVSLLLEGNCRQALQRTGGGVDRNADRFQGRHTQYRLGFVGSEDDAPGRDLAHELDLDEAEGTLMHGAIGELVAHSAHRNNAGFAQLGGWHQGIGRAGVDEKQAIEAAVRSAQTLDGDRNVRQSHVSLSFTLASSRGWFRRFGACRS